jgi:acyl dehydratase
VLAAAAAASEASIGAPVTFASFHVPASSSKPSPGELGVDFTCVAVPGGTIYVACTCLCEASA